MTLDVNLRWLCSEGWGTPFMRHGLTKNNHSDFKHNRNTPYTQVGSFSADLKNLKECFIVFLSDSW